MKRAFLSISICAILIIFAGIASATTTLFFDRASWLLATSSYTNIDFNSGGNQEYRGSSYTESSVTFTAYSIFSIYDIDYDAAYHDSGYLDLEGSPLGMAFGSNISALAFDLGAFYDKFFSLRITLGNGDGFIYNVPSSAYLFFGITTDTPFSSISMVTQNNTSTGFDDFIAFDNVSFGTAREVSVPEPSTMLFLGFGLVGLAGVARRKMKK